MQLIYTLENIDIVVKTLIDFLEHNNDRKVICFYGDMGSGKTTLIRAVCRFWKAQNDVVSPSFAIINEYETEKGEVYHFDFYRLTNIEEALNIGVEDYFYSNNYCFLEWAQIVEPILPQNIIEIIIEIISEKQRKLTILLKTQ